MNQALIHPVVNKRSGNDETKSPIMIGMEIAQTDNYKDQLFFIKNPPREAYCPIVMLFKTVSLMLALYPPTLIQQRPGLLLVLAKPMFSFRDYLCK